MGCFSLQVQILRQATSQPTNQPTSKMFGCCLHLAGCLAFSLTLKMEVVHSSKIVVKFYQITWHHVQEGSTHSHHWQNLKSSMKTAVSATSSWSLKLKSYLLNSEMNLSTLIYEKPRVIWNYVQFKYPIV